MNDTHDFLLEKRLQNEAPDLHRRVTDSVSMLYTMLESFLSWFPDFTDHSLQISCEKTPSDEIGCGMNLTSFSFCISQS